jgi:hypothetical protein
MIRDFRNKISFFMFFIVNKLKFLYFSIDIDEPTASLDPISVGKKNNNIFIIEAEMIIYSILRQKIGFLINFI